MCGIHAILSAILHSASEEHRNKMLAQYESYHRNNALRGPEQKQTVNVTDYLSMSFYRLAINGLNTDGMQPFSLPEFPHVFVICNGEIYNHVELENEIGYKNKSGSDCEIIVPLYAKFGFKQTVKLLDGVFGLVVWDSKENTLWVGRDRFGIRPLFLTKEFAPGTNRIVSYQIASELKTLRLVSDLYPGQTLQASQFLPGCFAGYRYDPENRFITQITDDRYFVHHWPMNSSLTMDDCLVGVNRLLRRAVCKRLMSERPIGCLLSGGLDSSLVASIVAEQMALTGRKPHTFSIGLPDATDLAYAREVADHIGSIHHEFILTQEEFLEALDHVVWIIESWDTTTVRASVGNYLVAKKIAEYNAQQPKFEDKVVVIFNGDGSDEVAGGYLYHHRNAPSMLEFHAECERLLHELCYFDVLRSDRTIADNGLEPRTPFLDPEFVGFYMSVPIDHRGSKSRPEKWLMREAFRHDNLLPASVLNRQKEAFSDGVSSKEKSWWEIIQDWILAKNIQQKLTTDVNKAKAKGCSDGALPQSIEAAYYRLVFSKHFAGQQHIIPHYWLPRWSGNVINPSARVLAVYKGAEEEEEDAKAAPEQAQASPMAVA